MRSEKLGVDSGNGSGTAHVVVNDEGRFKAPLNLSEAVVEIRNLCYDVSCRDQTAVR